MPILYKLINHCGKERRVATTLRKNPKELRKPVEKGTII